MAGQLVPDTIIHQVIIEAIAMRDQDKGIVGAGVLRTLSQLNWFEAHEIWEGYSLGLPLAIELQVPDHIAEERVFLRKRSDDTPAALHERFAHYRNETQPVLSEFANRNMLLSVDGTQSVEKVTEDITALLTKYLPEFYGTD